MLRRLFGMKRNPVDLMSVTAGPTVRVLTTAFCEANIQTKGKGENVVLKQMKSCKSEMEKDEIITIKVDIKIHNSLHGKKCDLL